MVPACPYRGGVHVGLVRRENLRCTRDKRVCHPAERVPTLLGTRLRQLACRDTRPPCLLLGLSHDAPFLTCSMRFGHYTGALAIVPVNHRRDAAHAMVHRALR